MCRIPLTNNITSRNRQLEELARALYEEDHPANSDKPTLTTPAPAPAPSAPELPGAEEGVREVEVDIVVEATDTSHLVRNIVVGEAGQGAGQLVVSLPPE